MFSKSRVANLWQKIWHKGEIVALTKRTLYSNYDAVLKTLF